MKKKSIAIVPYFVWIGVIVYCLWKMISIIDILTPTYHGIEPATFFNVAKWVWLIGFVVCPVLYVFVIRPKKFWHWFLLIILTILSAAVLALFIIVSMFYKFHPLP